MNLLDVIRDVRRLLAENGRISQRMLRKQFQLDDEALDELVEELVDVQRVAVLDGAVLAHVQAGDECIRKILDHVNSRAPPPLPPRRAEPHQTPTDLFAER